jgi:hypothetical protein
MQGRTPATPIKFILLILPAKPIVSILLFFGKITNLWVTVWSPTCVWEPN